jgi:hypothetical protein
LHRPIRKFSYSTEADLHKYLAERQWTLSDIYYQLKRNMIVQRLEPLVKRQIAAAGGGERGNVTVALARQKTRTARTKCEPGFVVSSCTGYRAGTPELASAVILEEIAKGQKG